MDNEDETTSLLRKKEKSRLTRNLIGFWLLGLTNNFGYVIMLSGAHDMLTPFNATTANASNEVNRTGSLVEDCNPVGTGAVLLADIIPALLVKLMAPVVLQKIPYVFRICAVLLFGVASFVLASFGGSEHVYVLNVIATWSSGTGAAGLLGSTSYAGLTSLGLTPKVTLLIMIVVPCLMACSYFLLLVSPKPGLLTSPSSVCCRRNHLRDDEDDDGRAARPDGEVGFAGCNNNDGHDGDDDGGGGGGSADDDDGGNNNNNPGEKTAMQKIKSLKPILKYVAPLFFVYLIEYIINQALYELIIFKNSWLAIPQQYRWYLVLYQVGVFISRSSVNFIHIPIVWVFPILQFAVLVLLSCQVFFHYIAYIFIVFVIIVFEGLFSGGAYVNAFYAILHTPQVPQEDKELCMSVTCVSDSCGIALAGVLAIPIHNYICSL
ncbi:hypothetical protein HELRODRAFT_194029 [Helobdella robusta]|uniref:Battenin n=1 Tax=Helobdella robusta TaxID=6412 RepID=T1FVL2_HELRO|nr:hypothetical protein HELRODRAFT_194029 [Helobdella robusta]ESN93487.1 hypothetical protein HELRODRAFT_194029 [Helobdella robusta]